MTCLRLRSLIHSRGADLSDQHSLQNPLESNKGNSDVYSMTLKQACSSEYQGAQGAFKDSMIH